MDADTALRYLMEMSTDIKQALLLGSNGELLATTIQDGADEAVGVAGKLLQLGSEASAGGDGCPEEMELSTEDGSVFVLHAERFTAVAVTGRSALPALILYDMRMVLGEMEKEVSG